MGSRCIYSGRLFYDQRDDFRTKRPDGLELSTTLGAQALEERQRKEAADEAERRRAAALAQEAELSVPPPLLPRGARR